MAPLISKLTDRIGERGLVWFVNLLLLGGIAQSITSVTWQTLDDESGLSAQAGLTPSIVNRSSQQSAILMAQTIASSHLFGRVVKGGAVQSSVSAPETKLNLLLKGVIASSDAVNSVAFITAGQTTVEKSYKIGDNLPGGAVLKEIYDQRILLEYRGRIENLSLLRKVLTSKELGTK